MFNYGLRQGHINEDWEILSNSYAVAYDSINNISVSGGNPKPTDIKDIKIQFSKLKRIAYKHAPELVSTINELEDITARYIAGTITDRQYLKQIRIITLQHNLSPELIDRAEHNINLMERANLSRVKPTAKIKPFTGPKISTPNFNHLFARVKPTAKKVSIPDVKTPYFNMSNLFINNTKRQKPTMRQQKPTGNNFKPPLNRGGFKMPVIKIFSTPRRKTKREGWF